MVIFVIKFRITIELDTKPAGSASARLQNRTKEFRPRPESTETALTEPTAPWPPEKRQNVNPVLGFEGTPPFAQPHLKCNQKSKLHQLHVLLWIK